MTVWKAEPINLPPLCNSRTIYRHQEPEREKISDGRESSRFLSKYQRVGTVRAIAACFLICGLFTFDKRGIKSAHLHLTSDLYARRLSLPFHSKVDGWAVPEIQLFSVNYRRGNDIGKSMGSWSVCPARNLCTESSTRSSVLTHLTFKELHFFKPSNVFLNEKLFYYCT